MNNIVVKENKSIYPIYDQPYLDISIDGIFLNELLDDIFPQNNIKGLVPPFSGWLSDSKDEEILWERILPQPNKTTVLPILICPDDQDYYCSTVVTNVIRNEELVIWENFGFNIEPALIGAKVDWFSKKHRFIFSFSEYKKAIADLQKTKN